MTCHLFRARALVSQSPKEAQGGLGPFFRLDTPLEANSATTNNTSSTPGTNASGSSDLDLYLKQISSDFERKKNFTHETALPQSDEQEMSLYVDNLTGEDVTHTERGFGLD